MKTKTLKKNKVNIVTLGCSKNLVDSEVLYTQLKGNGIDAQHESADEDSNIVIINTCGFIDNAKEESIQTILEYVKAKEDGNVEKVYVTGCLSERYKEELSQEIKGVDDWFGTRDLPRILKTFKADYKHELVGERLLTTPRHFAYFKISEGCDRPCSFCAIPIMRGSHVSKSIEELITEAKGLAAKGTQELILIAQDLTYYGLDLYKKRRLYDLLMHLSDIDGIEWIRLQYAYPAGFPLDILDAIAQRPNICKYIDMPLQHASDNMLKIMRRGITSSKTKELVHTIREKVPNIAIRTTLISGHPGETLQDHKDMLSFVEEMKFDRLGVFTYSHEEKTHAGDVMQDTISTQTKKKRAAEIMAAQEKISTKLNEAKIGKTYKVMIDRKEGEYYIGRTEYDSPEVDNEVLIDAKKHFLSVGRFVHATVDDAAEFDLYATPI